MPRFMPCGSVAQRITVDPKRWRLPGQPRRLRLQAASLRVLALLGVCVLLLPIAMGSLQTASAAPPAASSEEADVVGSYDVASVRILGVPAISVAAPVLSRDERGPDARQRAKVIEGNLALLYQPHSLCTHGEAISEALLEGLVLGGPPAQRLCSGDPWAVLGGPNDLKVVVTSAAGGTLQLQAQIEGRPTDLPLMTVTQEDARLHGLAAPALADRWRGILQRRLRHARRSQQPDQLLLRLKTVLVLAVLLAGSSVITLWLWAVLRRRQHRRLEQLRDPGQESSRDLIRQWLLRGLFLLVLVQLVLMVALFVSAIPGQIPLAFSLLLQPFAVLGKVLLLGLCALGLRLLSQFILRQWISNLTVPLEERARRLQRYRNLGQVSQRLIDLGCIALLILLVLADIPGVSQLTIGAWLAGGALLGGLAIAFQGLLRDGVAGLVALLDDHYAVGDQVEVNGVLGEVVDVGLLVTELRCADQRVLLFANGSAQQLVNHTKIRSGREVLIPLAAHPPQLERALAVLEAECRTFASDPLWSTRLLGAPVMRGVRRLTPGVIELSVMLTTRTGLQWEAQRELQRRLVVALQEAEVVLAGVGSPAGS